MDVCVALLAGTVLLRMPGPVRLGWQHSVERFALEERYHATSSGLQLVEVRGRGVGAGVDLPPQLRWSADGWWTFRPTAAAQQAQVVLANSRHGGGYRLCGQRGCADLAALPGAFDTPLVLRAC
jgi:hypothetical protein